MEFLNDTNIVVAIAFVIFLGVLAYAGVPGILAGLLDKRAEGIRSEIDEARTLREEAQSLLASYERKQKEVAEQAEQIIAAARSEAESAAAQAKVDMEASVARRLAAAKDQIASAEAAAMREVKDKAVALAVAAAGETIAKNIGASDANALIDEAISEVAAKLH